MLKIQNSLPTADNIVNAISLIRCIVLNYTASLYMYQLTTLLMPFPLVSSGVLFCDPKTGSPQIRLQLQPDILNFKC